MLTNKELIYLSEKQKYLDNYIMEAKSIVNSPEITKKKLIAFYVEVAEFINEQRSFKFWSNKKPSEKSILLEEYIDGIHFLISLGNDMEYDFSKYINTNEIKTKDIIENYLNVFSMTSNLVETQSIENYENLLKSFLNICYILDFTINDIIGSYNKKNEINFERQNSNY